MWKVIKIGDSVTVVLSNGDTFERNNLSMSEIQEIADKNTPESRVREIMDVMSEEKLHEYNEAVKLVDNIEKSSVLSYIDNAAYWKEISSLSLPPEFVEAIVKAEEAGDEIKMETYKNFWTLMSLNPNEECRKNLFWFLNKFGLTIAKCGFFLAYRNVAITDIPDVYTDEHSHTFNIKIGEMVTMPRNKCDHRQNVTCSQGLHLANKGWLKRNYFGTVGLACLCNPADVVAVPPEDSYGKLRTCAYLPIAKIEYDKQGNVIPLNVEDGFGCSYVTKVIYEGVMGTEEDSAYKITIPTLDCYNRESIQNTLLDIAMKCIVNKELL